MTSAAPALPLLLSGTEAASLLGLSKSAFYRPNRIARGTSPLRFSR